MKRTIGTLAGAAALACAATLAAPAFVEVPGAQAQTLGDPAQRTPQPQRRVVPPRQGAGAPSPRQGFGGPPPQQRFRGPPPQQGFGGPPPQQRFGGPPPQQRFRGPPPQFGGGPPPQQRFRGPPPQFGGPPPVRRWGPPPPPYGGPVVVQRPGWRPGAAIGAGVVAGLIVGAVIAPPARAYVYGLAPEDVAGICIDAVQSAAVNEGYEPPDVTRVGRIDFTGNTYVVRLALDSPDGLSGARCLVGPGGRVRGMSFF